MRILRLSAGLAVLSLVSASGASIFAQESSGSPRVVERSDTTDQVLTREYLIGPMSLPAQARHQHQLSSVPRSDGAEAAPWYLQSQGPIAELPTDGDRWLIEFFAEVLDEGGRPLPGTLLCHTAIVQTATTKRPSGPDVVTWSGGELSHMALPSGYGILMPAGKRFQLISLFRNPFLEDYQNVYLKVTMRFLNARPETSRLRNARLIGFSVSLNAEDPTYVVPPGVDIRRERVTFPFAGTVVQMIGHLHAPYGVRVQLDNLTTHKTVWAARATKSGDGKSLTLPTWSQAANFHVEPTERYELTAEYRNTSDEPFDAMGVMGAFVVPDGP